MTLFFPIFGNYRRLSLTRLRDKCTWRMKERPVCGRKGDELGSRWMECRRKQTRHSYKVMHLDHILRAIFDIQTNPVNCSQFAKLFYAIKRIMRLSEISLNTQIKHRRRQIIV